MLENIPRELRERASFVVWNYQTRPGASKPTKPPLNANTGWPADVTKPSDWSSYDQAVAAYTRANGQLQGIGYVISRDDPYTFIDLDTHDEKLSDDDKRRHDHIANTFKGYAEISPSGKGLHLIVKGKVPTGRRRAGVEIYSADRYMTLTGNVWRAGEIIEQQELLTQLWTELGGNENEIAQASFKHEPQTDDDFAICDRASQAVNGEKFIQLYSGKWNASYSSQSEADFALIDILGFYTRNVEQIKRIFRQSSLGQRDKAKREDYLNGMIVRSQDNQPPLIDLSALKLKLDKQIEESNAAEAIALPMLEAESDDVHSLPPGLLGEIAQYIYQSAPRPVKEIALVGALGLMAGICGRAYNVNNTGLNLYLMLLASTGSGKEAIASRISAIINKVAERVPVCREFIGPEDIRSDVALTKYMANTSQCFVSIVGEFGYRLQQMASTSQNQHQQGIKKVMLHLYNKSGRNDTLQPTVYSDADKGTKVIHAPSFSLIGESSPEVLYEAIDERMINDGLLPRFTIIEYLGKRVDLNPNANFDPPPRLIENIAALCSQAKNLMARNTAIDVPYSPEATKLFAAFERKCTDLINDSVGETNKAIWNRAHIRALRTAALIAVGCGMTAPVIEASAAAWAIKLSEHSTQLLLNKFASGEVGAITSDSTQMRLMKQGIKKFAANEYKKFSNHSAAIEVLHRMRIVPYVVIQNHCANLAAFKNDRIKAKFAIENSVKMLCDSGVIMELDKKMLFEKYAYSGRAYSIMEFDQL